MTPETLWTEYIRERQGLEAIVRPFGFVTYRIVEGECFIADMFIREPDRQLGNGRSFIAELVDICRTSGCKVLTANVHLSDPNASSTLVAALACGFEVKKADHDVLLIAMEIKEI